jgi:hypothetical protein
MTDEMLKAKATGAAYLYGKPKIRNTEIWALIIYNYIRKTKRQSVTTKEK